jgi:hypothetical protein
MKQYKIDNIFPTSIIQCDCSDVITEEDQQQMIDNVNYLIESGKYIDTQSHPKYQTNTNLFNSKNWEKLRSTFIDSCFFYLENVKNFVYNQEKLKPFHLNSWAYKSWKSINLESGLRPWHNHNPAFLSGVFYLKIPGDQKYGGTEFSDPRFSQCSMDINYMSTPIELTWIIFPSCLYHRTVFIDSEEPRYVISADIYCAPHLEE